MKIELIKEGQVYMAVRKGAEILIKVDFVLLGNVYGKQIETGAGIAIKPEFIMAGPILTKTTKNIGRDQSRLG